ADVKGNVGYQTPGRIPIRAKHHSGLLPVPGWTNEFEWQGFIPFDKLPTVFNPKRGYVATANQAVVPLEYYDMLASELGEGENYAISQEWDYGYRGQRIIELLEKLAPHSIETLQVLQGDNKLISAEELIPYLGRLRFNEPELNEARDWLMKWDYQFDMDSPQAALYAEFWMQLANNLFGDQLPEQIKLEGWAREMWAAYLLMEQPNDTWWDDASTSDVVETRDDILVRSFREGYNNAVATLGNDRSRWRWGNLHTSTFVSNPLGRSGVSFIEKMVNRGPYPTSGCTGAVNNTRWTVHSGSFTVDHLPSMRMIVDLGDLTRSVAIHTTGQSGHPYSKHYDDMIELWRNIKYHPMLWTRAQVEAAAANKLILKPAN
ncbi:MAG: penicillin acylase family protein, partial [Chloroflexi bacterium]|nr:penicillin acylase family protein [Chloroflexota bacterium]